MAGYPIYVALDAKAFRLLVSGQETTVRAAGGQEVRIILSDIGFDRMVVAIRDAMRPPRAPAEAAD